MDREKAIFYIKELQKTYAPMDKKVAEAVDMAIEALSAEPTDLISKSAVMETIGYWTTTEEWGHYFIPDKLVDMINELPSASVPTKCIARINIDADEVVKRIKDEYEIDDNPTELLEDGTLKVNVKSGTEVSRVLVWGDDGCGGLYYADDRPTEEWKINCTDFVDWLLGKVLDEEDWDINCKAYGEIICRKLKKLGVVTVKDGYYIIADDADRPTGKWVYDGVSIANDEDSMLYWKCSECGHEGNPDANYCGFCGAKMGGNK